MKTILIFFLAIMTISVVQARQNTPGHYAIVGQFANASSVKVFITAKSNYSKFSDSTLTDVKGNFVFRGQVSEPQPFTLKFSDQPAVYNFFVDNTTIKLSGDAKKIKDSKAIGPHDQVIFDEYKNLNRQLLDYQEKLNLSMSGNTKTHAKEMKALLQVNRQKLMDSLSRIYEAFLRKYPGSAVAVYVMDNLISERSVNSADSLMHLIEQTPAGEYPTSKRLRTLLNSKLSRQPGKPASDFSQPDTSGIAYRLSDFKGKYVFVDFWASWCIPCRTENPNVINAYNRFKDKNFTVISVSLDANKSSWVKAIKEDKLPWLQLSDLKALDNLPAKMYGVTAIPSNFLVDPNGKIIAADVRGLELEYILEATLNKSR